jgi:glycerol-3-phosphate cytidylyltransferase-like family protein
MKKLVIIPGGFHPFHAGHMALYNAARAAFPSAEVYVAATADTSTRKFPFEIKEKLARLSGIPAHRFIQVKNPFRAEEITQHFDPNETQLIFVRSEKDRNQEPQAGGVKKDGSSSYLQPYKRNGLQPMSQHGYMAYLPVVQFGPGMTSATEIRAKWPDMDADAKAKLVNQLYPATVGNDPLTNVTIKLLDQGMGIKDVAENYGGAGDLIGAPIGGGAIDTKTLNMPNGPDELDEDPAIDTRRHMIKQVFQSGKDFVNHLKSLPDSELEALYQERPQMRELMKQLHSHVNKAMQSKVLDTPSHQASDYIEEN